LLGCKGPAAASGSNTHASNAISSSSAFTLRWTSLCAFVLSHAVLTCVLRVDVLEEDEHNPVIVSTVVCGAELCKLLLSCVAVMSLDCTGNTFSERIKSFFVHIRHAFLNEAADIIKLCVPSLLYTFQNNFQYVIETSPLFVILYQGKNITTAIFYQTMLGRKIRKGEWLAIASLTLGIALVQASQQDVHIHHAKLAIGLFSVTCACLTSGFAGVYFEKTMMQSKSTIWMINLQMSLVGTSLSMFACLAEDTEFIAKRGFFAGYTWLTWLVIFLQAVAGLSIAAVCRYADNIYKGFAYGWSVLLACMCEYYWFGEHALLAAPDVFGLGAGLILLAAGAYVWLHELLIPQAMTLMEEHDRTKEVDFQVRQAAMVNAPSASDGTDVVADDDGEEKSDEDMDKESDNLLGIAAPSAAAAAAAARGCSASCCIQSAVEYICETSHAELARHLAMTAAHHSHKERDRTQSSTIALTGMKFGSSSSAAAITVSAAAGTSVREHGGVLTARGPAQSSRMLAEDIEEGAGRTGAGVGTAADGKYTSGSVACTPQGNAVKDKYTDFVAAGGGPSTPSNSGTGMASAGATPGAGSRLAQLVGNAVASTPIYRSVRDAMGATRDFFSEEPER